ncbi:PAS domain-containing protein, partial [Prolixibacter bellariivorans]|uniref:PAS domain-containing protein n=1 Tax=Prolixibacter bellariivorans TaxID=314319 RepID=UPI0011DD7ADC
MQDYISGNFSSITGYADEVFFKKGWWAKNIHPDDAQEVFKNLGELFQKGNHSHEYRFLFNDGSWHWMHDDLKLIKDDSGNPIELIGTWQDVTDRKLAELKLKESEAKLTDAMKIAKLSTWEYDFVLDRFTFPDQSFALFNTTAEQEGGNTMSSEHFAQKYIYPDDRVLIEKGLRKALETPDPAYTSQLEYRVIYAPGEIGYFAANVRIEKDADNRTIKALGVNQDITERKRVEDEIRKNEYRYRDLFENSGTPIWEIDLSEAINYITGLKEKGIGDLRTYFDEHIDEVIHCVSMVKLIDANKEILNFFKATQKEDVLTGLFDFFIEESFDTAKDVLVALARTEENQKIGGEIPVKTLTGETKQAIFRISVVPEDENTLAKSLISFIDITERKQAEKALRERENSYRTLAENIPASVYRLYLRERGKMEFFNNVIEQMSGYTKDELRNGEICSIDPFIFPEDKQYVMEIVKNALRDNSEFEVEYRFIRKDGSLSYFHEKGRPVVGNDGKPLYIEGVIFDDTERNRTEKEIKEKNEQLKKLNAEKDKFFSIIAHDLKSPFYGFLNLTELMSDS